MGKTLRHNRGRCERRRQRWPPPSRGLWPQSPARLLEGSEFRRRARTHALAGHAKVVPGSRGRKVPDFIQKNRNLLLRAQIVPGVAAWLR